MKCKNLAAVTIALGVGLSTSVAQAATFTDLSGFGDSDFNNAKNSGLFEEDWVAEGRIGNDNPESGVWEQGIWNWTTNSSNSLVEQGGLDWNSGGAVAFTINYQAADGGTLTYTLGGQTISSTNLTEASRFPNGLNALYIRTRSNNAGDSVSLNNFQLVDDNGTFNYNTPLDSSDGDTVNYLLISDIEGDFTLTGDATLSWLTSRPNNSALAFQVKGGNVVPEPFTILGSATALGFGTFFKKKLSKKQRKS
ncbi:PEP-CTERM sorting domain-containing protein [Cyanothece sp. BG0011]|uniref:PEP-CTERM sorting domain-containing protein n=1 Tax=Cyanothece sp. BG0011 TaxID=2082950 RepID=UPI00130073BB|nr:PEP-CTERM sorting domain-containing protein [Cyanothece sp. BG0011]